MNNKCEKPISFLLKRRYNKVNDISGIEREDTMKKVTLVLSIIFLILTFVGVGYVLCNRGKVNAGYAVVPMVFTLVCITFYRNRK